MLLHSLEAQLLLPFRAFLGENTIKFYVLMLLYETLKLKLKIQILFIFISEENAQN